MSEPVPVLLPSGQLVYLDPAGSGRASGPRDVGLGDTVVEVLQVPGIVESIEGVLDTVRLAVAKARPDTFSVEFGIELNVKTGKVLSVLAEAGGKAQLKITATWGKATAPVVNEVRDEVEAPAEEPSP